MSFIAGNELFYSVNSSVQVDYNMGTQTFNTEHLFSPMDNLTFGVDKMIFP